LQTDDVHCTNNTPKMFYVTALPCKNWSQLWSIRCYDSTYL